jgi:uncharacterized protein YjbI with pentapeptide repeats
MAELRKISKDELEKILAEHKKWVESDKKEGKQANFSQADLTNANLSGANLRNANLQNANLEDTGISAKLLGATNLLNAKLPENIPDFDNGLKNVEEASKNARKLFVSMLLGCLYLLLSIGATKDIDLLIDPSSSPLPLIQTTISMKGFYFFAPLLLLGLYIYFHIYLQRLWERLATLPAIFQDGKRLDEEAYPWLLNGLVYTRFEFLKKERPHLSCLQNAFSVLLAWGAVPLTLAGFWLRYSHRHDWILTYPHLLFLSISIWSGIVFYLLASRTLRGKKKKEARWKKDLKYILHLSFILLLFHGFFSFSKHAMKGFLLESELLRSICFFSGGARYDFFYQRYDFFYRLFSFSMDIHGKEISIKPENWTGGEENSKNEIPLVIGAKLRGVDLMNALASKVFLVKAELRQANLSNADLSGADLRGADLERADLRVADLRVADLRGANLREALLDGVRLEGADLRGTRLEGARLGVSDLRGADFREADLRGADLRGANLREARLERANLAGADLSSANLERADLRSANLERANLSRTDLTEADLPGAKLKETNLKQAMFKNTKTDLTVEELKKRGALVIKEDKK